eukprot:CAMPEP_0118639140 /NCGR_PEP_ID=MMETSP0785-20121206/4066_1 /TAXON_ID=91992 /ORGANISM="Bolidomonas pacifica, Strain CCMP 1866" /LENGTH=216 /DNA_ID=CAMNT_0006530451 /DNA_START=78 /DNA_END=725 /DNA_ORIENTATION=+
MGAATSVINEEASKPLDGSDLTPRGESAKAEVVRLRKLLASHINLTDGKYGNNVTKTSHTPITTPLIFLDVDGVLHPLTEKHFPVGADVSDLVDRADEDSADVEDVGTSRICKGEFHAQCMQNLKEAVERTGARIVLSTTWRESGRGRRAVDSKLNEYGIPEHIGCTSSLGYQGRGKEILEFIKGRNVETNWVAIDDMDLKGLGDNFIRIKESVGL